MAWAHRSLGDCGLASTQPTEMAAHRKLDRSRADLWADTVLKCGGALPLFSLRLDREMLLFALEKQPIEQQQDHGAHDRHDPARWLSGLVPAEGLAEVTGNERASDAEQNRDDKTTGIFPRHQQLCDSTDNKADNQSPND